MHPMTAHNAKPNEVIVKFHDRSDMCLSPQNPMRFSLPTCSVGINTVLDEYEVERIE